MIDQQTGRRNVTKGKKAYLMGKRYDLEKRIDKFKGNQHTNSGGGNFYHHQKTSEQIAAENNVSERTVRRNADYASGVD